MLDVRPVPTALHVHWRYLGNHHAQTSPPAVWALVRTIYHGRQPSRPGASDPAGQRSAFRGLLSCTRGAATPGLPLALSGVLTTTTSGPLQEPASRAQLLLLGTIIPAADNCQARVCIPDCPRQMNEEIFRAPSPLRPTKQLTPVTGRPSCPARIQTTTPLPEIPCCFHLTTPARTSGDAQVLQLEVRRRYCGHVTY